MDAAEWIVFGILLGFSVCDLKWKKIWMPSVMILGIAVLIYRLVAGTGILEIVTGLIPGMGLLAVSYCTKESIGIGDGVVLGVLGMFCGLRKVLAVLGMALVLSALLAMILLVLKRADRKTELPFLPCLFAGYLVSLLW